MSVKVLTVKEDILSVNDANAKVNRERADKHHVVMVNVMSSPGAGKTTLITQTINKFKEKTRMAPKTSTPISQCALWWRN